MTTSQTLTLTLADTAYSLLDLMRTADANYVDVGLELSLQADADNTGSIKIGSAGMTSSNYGYVLFSGEGRVYSRVPHLQGLYALGSAAGQKINVEVRR